MPKTIDLLLADGIRIMQDFVTELAGLELGGEVRDWIRAATAEQARVVNRRYTKAEGRPDCLQNWPQNRPSWPQAGQTALETCLGLSEGENLGERGERCTYESQR